MKNKIKVYIDIDSIYKQNSKTYDTDYINICLKFAVFAEIIIVCPNNSDCGSILEYLMNKIKGLKYVTCNSIDKLVIENYGEEIIFVISDIYTAAKTEKNIIKFSLDFDLIQEEYSKKSFVELAKRKLIYTQFSGEFSFLIEKNTANECQLIKSVLWKNNVKSGKILDCCCGVGRHDVYLAEHGYEILGIDISKKQIETARQTNNNNRIIYTVGDIRNYKFPCCQFDGAICMWTSFNYLSKTEMKDFINNVYEGLKNKGFLILDTKNFSFLLEYKLYFKNLENDTKKVRILVIKRIKNRIQISKYIYFIFDKVSKRTSFFIDNEIINIYLEEDILEIVDNKFSKVDLYGDYEMSNYDKKVSDRLIMVLKRL